MTSITICATESYTYAMISQLQRVISNIHSAKLREGVVILVGDKSAKLAAVRDAYQSSLPSGWSVTLIAREDFSENGEKNYKKSAQLLISEMRQTAFTEARRVGSSMCWSLDSDVLPPHNALRCSIDMLKFDDGYYSISTCPYPNSLFLGGFGSPTNHIAEDFLPHERKLPTDLMKRWKADEAELKKLNDQKKPVTDEHRSRWAETHAKIKECPPDGNIWEVIAKHGWRRRGWLDHAYPAIGRGAVVPSDWCGFGCTLMNEEALSLANFDGYEGHGTEDLYVVWKRWHPAGLRLNVITHCPCDHVIWEKKKGGDAGKYTLLNAYHEEAGEYRGHLRQRSTEWPPRPSRGEPSGSHQDTSS